jgi:integrase
MDGKNPKTVSDRLGHASVTLTLDVYSHILPHIQDEATDAMDRIMRGIK